ncbi:MAG: AI-2E family transporter [Deferribacterota bacterium]|nr:AI-2E family transporter [Deferribacterota bacterium]
MSELRMEIKLKTLISIFFLFLIAYFIFKINNILTPFALAFFIVYLLDPLISGAEKYKIPRSVSIISIFLFITAFIVGLFLLLTPLIYNELSAFAKDVPYYIDRLSFLINNVQSHFGVDISTDRIKDLIASKTGEITNVAYKALGKITYSLKSIITTIVLYSIVPILIFYFAKDYKYVTESVIKTIEENSNFNVRKYLSEFDEILSSYFRGQIIVALILGVLYSIVLLIVDLKPALIVGLSAGVLSIIPYLGFVVGFATSLVLAYLQYFDIWHPLFVVIGFTVVQIIESNYITPKIVGNKLGLHPTAVIFSLLAGGSLLGIAGMIFSLPIAAAIKIWLNKIISSLKS